MQHFSFKMPVFFCHSVGILRGYQRAVSPTLKAHSSWLIAFFAFVLSFSAFAQQPMPITGSLQINSPYPATWSEYAATGVSRMGLNLTLNDAEIGSMNVRLKLYIERNNTLIATSSDVVTGVPTLNLAPFITKQLGALDLNPYFRFENLQGFSTPQYQQPLEDGVYRLSFQVVNAVTGQRLSDMIGQSMFITLNDPPQLTQPIQGEQLKLLATDTIKFQWLSRATTVAQIQYEWTVIEVPVGTTNLEALWATAPILYRATTITNSLPRLASGFATAKTYAWRVQAKTQTGISLFRNNGFSETFTFQMGSTCLPVSGLLLTPKASDVIAVSWTGATTYYNYRVAYRKYSLTTVWQWVEQPTTNSYLNLTGLEAATEYEVKIGGVCANGATGFSAPLRATTLALGQIQGLNCGQMPALPAAGTPITLLKKDDVITAGDFLVTLTSVSGSAGNFSGEGWVKIPWMGSTKIKVIFSGIGVNTEKKLTTGFLQTAYDPSWGNILNVDGIFEGGTNVGIIRSGRDTAEFYSNFPINGTSGITSNATNGTITVRGGGGQSQTFSGVSLPTTIKDNLGQIYGVDANGQVILVGRPVPMTMTSTELNALSDKGSAVFTQPTAPQLPIYAFDAYQDAYDKDLLWREKYEKIGTYGVGRKAGAPGKPDIINARVVLTDATLKADSVRFITAKGMQYTSRSLGAGLYEINVVGGPGGDGQELYALHPKADGKYFSLGKVAIFSYMPKKRKMVLVPVKNAQTDPLLMQKQLNDIYKPIGIEWEVEPALTFTDVSWDANNNGLDVKGSGKFSVLTTEMKALNKAYRSKNSIYKDAIYMFVLDKASDSTVLGDMPRGKQFGYLFTTNNNQQGKTVAHEIGHGMFKLKHPADGYNFTPNLLNANLMDNGSGINLSKYQWDQIHEPGLALGLFDSDEDAFLVGVGTQYKFSEVPTLEKPTCTGAVEYQDLAPNGYPIKTRPTVKSRHIEASRYVVVGYTVVEGGNDVEYKAIYDGEGKFIAYTLGGSQAANAKRLPGIVFDEEANKDVIITVRKVLDNCYFQSTNICWTIPQSPLSLQKVVTIVESKTIEKKWVIATLDACGNGNFKKDFANVNNTNGKFYSLGRENEAQVKNLIEEINYLVSKLMNDADYGKYIVIPMGSKKFLTLAELQDLYESLILIKTSKDLVSPSSTFENIINWIKTCNEGNSESCAVADNLVPRCLWDNDLASSPIGLELPIRAGVIDGAYQMLKGIGDLAVLAGKFQIGQARFFNCWLNPLEFTSLGLDPECKTTRNNTLEGLNFVKQFAEDEATRNTVYRTYDSFKALMGNKFDTWWNQTFKLCGNTPQAQRCCFYNQGRLMFDVASCFFGVGELKLAGTGGNILAKITGQLGKLDNLLGKLNKASGWLKLDKVAGGARQGATIGLLSFKLATSSMASVASTAPPVIEIAAASARTIEALIPSAIIEVEQAIRITAPVGAALTGVEAATLKTTIQTLAPTVAETSTAMFEKVAFEVGGVQKAAGNIGIVKTSDNVFAVIAKAENDFQVLARVTVAATGGATLSMIETPPNPKKSNMCETCPNRDKDLCENLGKLQTYTTKRNAIKKLCESSLNDLILTSIVNRLLNQDRIISQAFLKDIESTEPLEHIGANVSNLTINIMNAWELVYNAAINNKFSDNYRRDMELLRQVNIILNDNTLIRQLGNEDGLKIILQKNYNAPCYTCKKANKSDVRSNMSDFLIHVQYFANTYRNIPSSSTLIGAQGMKSDGLNQVNATAYILRLIYGNQATFNSNSISFEESYTAIPPFTNDCIADIRLGTGGNRIICEFKSWSTRGSGQNDEGDFDNPNNNTKFVSSNGMFWNIGMGYASTTQFLCYLQQISSMDNLRYYFDAKWPNVTENMVKNSYHQMMYDINYQAKNLPDPLTDKGRLVFEAIWSNTTLRASLFTGINFTQPDAIIRPIALGQFRNKVASTSDNFYNFINVR